MILGAKDAQNSAASSWIRQLASRCDAVALCWVARDVLVGFVVVPFVNCNCAQWQFINSAETQYEYTLWCVAERCNWSGLIN